MIIYPLVPVAVLAAIALQVSLADILSFGAIRVSLSLVLVVYFGLYLDTVRGGALTLLAGCIMDTLAGSFAFFYVVFYCAVFAGSKLASFRVYGENAAFVVAFVFFCAILEAFVIALLHWYSHGAKLWFEGMGHLAVQALPLALVSPLFFSLLRKCEDMVHAGTPR